MKINNDRSKTPKLAVYYINSITKVTKALPLKTVLLESCC